MEDRRKVLKDGGMRSRRKMVVIQYQNRQEKY